MSTLKNKILDRLSFDELPTEDELKTKIKSLIPTYLPELTDLNSSSNLIRLTDLLCVFMGRFILDLSIDVANESMLSVASQYEWAARRAMDLGYTPSPGSGSTVILKLTRTSGSATPTIVTRDNFVYYTRSALNSPRIRFEMLDTEAVIPAGDVGTSVTFTAVMGTRYTGDILGTADGSSLQRYTSSRYRSSPGYELLFIDGIEWIRATDNNLMRHSGTDCVYELSYTEDGNAIFQFGDGNYGAKPMGIMSLEQRILPDGVDGNVAAGTIIDMSPASAKISVTNELPASGWAAPESIDSIKFLGSRAIRINSDCCSPENIEANVENHFLHVGRCYVVPGDRGENTIGVYVCGNGGEDLTNDQLLEIKEYVDLRNTGTEFVFVSNIEYINITVAGTVYVNQTYSITDVQADVEAEMTEYFSPVNIDSYGNRTVDPNGVLYRSFIEHKIMSIAGVSNVSLTSPPLQTGIPSNCIPRIIMSVTYTGA